MTNSQIKKELVAAWLAGYFTGFEFGISKVASILKTAKAQGCPVPEECADIFEGMGIAIEHRIDAMLAEERALNEEDDNG